MLAKLKFENVLVNGERRAKLVAFENILYDEDLPREYVEGDEPAFLRPNDSTDGFVVRLSNDPVWWGIRIGSIFTQIKLAHLISSMKQAGKRLTEINKRAKDKAWVGKTFEVEI